MKILYRFSLTQDNTLFTLDDETAQRGLFEINLLEIEKSILSRALQLFCDSLVVIIDAFL